ncbi:MAG: methyltransferase domain-containing protein [Bacteroidales bacterium]|nr:methyltransferase domain-containing protein [Bacteroidales bacterium]
MWIINVKIFRKFLYRVSRFIQIGSSNKRYYRNGKILDELFSQYEYEQSSVSLDIGSGPIPKNPFQSDILYGADFRADEKNNVVYSDLSLGQLPFENEKCDFITAFDVLEHIQRVVLVDGKTIFPFISLMNEIFRILKPGGIFFSMQPVYPSKSVFQDPTHVNIMSEDTMDFYFCSKAWARIYGYEGSFVMIKDGWIGDKYFCFMKKSAEEPIYDLEFIQK